MQPQELSAAPGGESEPKGEEIDANTTESLPIVLGSEVWPDRQEYGIFPVSQP
jgi:hypothetical protein